MSEETLWRCRRCGKWSHAKRDPIAHKPVRPSSPDCAPTEWREEWCGPFDRWVAHPEDPSPREELPHIGQPVNPNWADDLAPYYEPSDVEVPF